MEKNSSPASALRQLPVYAKYLKKGWVIRAIQAAERKPFPRLEDLKEWGCVYYLNKRNLSSVLPLDVFDWSHPDLEMYKIYSDRYKYKTLWKEFGEAEEHASRVPCVKCEEWISLPETVSDLTPTFCESCAVGKNKDRFTIKNPTVFHVQTPLGEQSIKEKEYEWVFTQEGPKDTAVEQPAHYTMGPIACVDAVESAICKFDDPIDANLTAHILEYVWRWKYKNGVEDLRKAQWYLNRLIERKETNPAD